MTDATTRSAVLDDLAWRGLIVDSTDLQELRAAAAAGPVTLYCGFDPTAPSLHIGHLMQTLTLRRFQLAGHRPLPLVGGATGLIGDPKMAGERRLNDAAVVREWGTRIRDQLAGLLDFEDPRTGAVLVNNYEWTERLSAIEFLRDVGKHFPVNRMLDREAVSARLAAGGISYTEFSYVLLQSYDYLELYRRHGCTLQIGGSDQWGNITAGVDLVRRVEAAAVHAMTTPLLTRADGSKFGKTEGGTVWLDPALTSPYAFFQFWLNSDDDLLPSLLRTFTFRPREQVEELVAATRERPQERQAQRALAHEVTSLVHGRRATEDADAASRALFGSGDLRALDAATLAAALEQAGGCQVPRSEVRSGVPVADLLVRAGLVPSKGAARRVIREGGAYLGNVRVGEESAVVGPGDLVHDRWLVLRRGRRHVAAVEVLAD